MHHEATPDLTPLGPLTLIFEPDFGFTCPHHEGPVVQCDDCALSMMSSQSGAEPDQSHRLRSWRLSRTQRETNPDHVCSRQGCGRK